MTTPEGKVKAKIKKALNALPKCYSFMPVQTGMGAATLDYLCCINGHFVAIEAKASGKCMTPRQVMTTEIIVKAGGAVFVVDGDESLERVLWLIEGICQ